MKRTIQIKGKTWKIKRKKNPTLKGVGPCHGVADLQNRIIILDSRMKGDQLTKIFIHELLHGCIHELHLKEHGGIDDAVEEILVEGLADILTTLFEMKLK